MNVTVSAFGWAKRHKRDFDAVISIEDPDAKHKLRFNRNPHPDHLILQFVDLDRPAPAPYDTWPVFRLAEEGHIQAVLEFTRKREWENLLVHCQAGVGRSAAIALTIIADQIGECCDGDQMALDQLLDIRPESVPNLHVVALADKALGRNGDLLRIVQEWDAQRPENQRRRELNRQAHFAYYGLNLPKGS